MTRQKHITEPKTSMDQFTKEILAECLKTFGLPAAAAYGTHWWHTRTRSNLDGLQVFPTPTFGKITPDEPGSASLDLKPQKVPGILFEFKNNTAEVVFIQRCRLTEVTEKFRAHNKAFFDVGEHSYELKFKGAASHDYNLKEVILQTGQSSKTMILLETEWDGQIPKKHSRKWLPPFTKKPILFCISYEVTAGERSYKIRTTF